MNYCMPVSLINKTCFCLLVGFIDRTIFQRRIFRQFQSFIVEFIQKEYITEAQRMVTEWPHKNSTETNQPPSSNTLNCRQTRMPKITNDSCCCWKSRSNTLTVYGRRTSESLANNNWSAVGELPADRLLLGWTLEICSITGTGPLKIPLGFKLFELQNKPGWRDLLWTGQFGWCNFETRSYSWIDTNWRLVWSICLTERDLYVPSKEVDACGNNKWKCNYYRS